MNNNILFPIKITLMVVLIQCTYLFENVYLHYTRPILLIIAFILLQKNTDKQQNNNIAKNITIIILVLFSLYNCINFIKLLNSYNRTNEFMKKIDINSSEEYLSLINNYKYNDNNSFEFYKNRFKNSLFVYDKVQSFAQGGILMTSKVIETDAKSNQSIQQLYNGRIVFLNNEVLQLKGTNKMQKSIAISLIINVLLVDLTSIYYIKRYNKI